MFKKKPIGNFIDKLKDKRTSNKRDGEDTGTVRIRMNNQQPENLFKNNSPSNPSENTPTATKNSIFSKIQFQTHKKTSQEKPRENFSKKLMKKFSRSADSIKSQDDMNSEMHKNKEKSHSLNDNRFFGHTTASSSPINSTSAKNASHLRFHNNFYRRFKGPTRPDISSNNTGYQNVQSSDVKAKQQNKAGVVDRIATFLKFDHPVNGPMSTNVTENQKITRQSESEEDRDDDEDDEDDSIFVDDDDSSESEQEDLSLEELLIRSDNQIKYDDKNKKYDNDDDLEKQILHEIYLLDKILEQYS